MLDACNDGCNFSYEWAMEKIENYKGMFPNKVKEYGEKMAVEGRNDCRSRCFEKYN